MNESQQSELYSLQHFFFDLDGTLADSQQDVVGSIEQAYADLGFPYDKSKLRIGPLLPEIIATVSPQLNRAQQELVARTFRAVYAAGKYRNTVLFSGVRAFLEKLAAAGKTLYVATNKPKVPTLEVLDALGIRDMFFYIGTPDSTGELLTKPEVLRTIVGMFDLDPARCVMIGDTRPDMEAGKYAGMKTLAFTGGYGGEDLKRCDVDFKIDLYTELL